MSRTTPNIASPVLEELKRLQREDQRPLGDLASELLAEALTLRKSARKPKPFSITVRNPLAD